MALTDCFKEYKPFPGQDPHVISYKNEYLLTQSAYNSRRIVIKRFSNLQEMNRNQSQTVWMGKERQLWAPELHQILGKWYLYYSASDGNNPTHRTYVLESDCPFGPYHSLGKLITPNNEDFWSIDTTILQHHTGTYAIWSGWESTHAAFPQHLYGARLLEPNRIAPRFLLASPEFNWEQTIAPILEGPQILIGEYNRLFIAYSADASWTNEYKMGLLEYMQGPILDPLSWKKLPNPWITGGGHGCFVDDFFVYHRKLSNDSGWADREIVKRNFIWQEGYPKLLRD